jgi:hypothetical protein
MFLNPQCKNSPKEENKQKKKPVPTITIIIEFIGHLVFPPTLE